MNKVSVIIATRNRPVWLTRAVKSALNQTYDNIEIVVVDENDPGSAGREQTREAIRALDDPRILYLDDRRPTWVCTARNEGVSKCTGDIVCFLDDDDWWEREKIAAQLQLLETSPEKPGLVYTGLRVVDESGTTLKERRPHLRGHLLEHLLVENVIGTPSSIMMERSVFESIGGFDAQFPTRHDLDLYIRVASQYPVECVSDPLTVYLNQNPLAMSKNLENKVEGRRLILEKHAKLFENRNDLLGKYHYGTALLYLKHQQWDKARTSLWQSLKTRFSLKALLRLLSTNWFG